MEYKHVPVMLSEAVEYLNPGDGKYYIDCTLGGGGYTMALRKIVGESGMIVSVDMDEMAIKNAEKIINENKYKNIKLIHDNFRNLSKIIEENFQNAESIKFDGIVFDLGLSGAQLEDRTRGFSFREDAPLDMSFGGKKERGRQSTEYLINNSDEIGLARMIREYGEEKFARNIARSIIKNRKEKPITTTVRLVDIILSAIPKKFQHGKIHPATKTFQAFRIATNEELRNIEEALPQALNLLGGKGRIVIISYHSLEDRIVKLFLKKESRGCVCPPDFPVCICGMKPALKIITKKAILPSPEEVKGNPRARSAKMRVAEKI